MQNREVTINLMENNERTIIKSRNLLLFLSGIILLLGGMTYSYSCMQKQLEILQAENTMLEDSYLHTVKKLELQEINKISNDKLQDKKNIVLQVKNTKTPIVEILEEIENAVPAGVTLFEVEVSDRKTILKGFAPSYCKEAILLCELRGSIFNDVEFAVSSIREEIGGVLFEAAVAWEEENNEFK